jgi:iron(III) transport system substrate-binding protein
MGKGVSRGVGKCLFWAASQRSAVICCLCLCLLAAAGCARQPAREVVVYTSVDQVFSEPILRQFEQASGITVKPVYDVEASKTVGLVNRLLAEKERPRCDVFWNSEFARTIVLKKQGILARHASPATADIPETLKDRDSTWFGFSARARVFIYNKVLLAEEQLPRSLRDLLEPQWRGQVALAYPLFGTTATHMAALFSVLGKTAAEDYLKALHANQVVLVDGNAVVRDLVAAGQVPLGLTDTDDVHVAIQAGKPVGMLFPDTGAMGTLLIPNTVALIHGCPHPDEGKALVDYLLSRDVESRLAFSEAAQIPVRAGVERPPHVPAPDSFTVMPVDFEAVAAGLEETARFCQSVFVR